MSRIKKVLIVVCRFDEDRNGGSRPWRVPQAMAPVFIAGGFNPKLCDLRLYSELYSGPLEDKKLLAWPDMLVLSGLQVDFDRFLHLTAYARTLNPHVIVVAGGSVVEMLPKFSRPFFDYCCTGAVEEINEVIAEAFGKEYVAEVFAPRHDLAYWNKILGMVESSRYCNFNCSFCALSIKSNAYLHYSPEHVREEIRRTGFKRIFFLDNNFYGNNAHEFNRKLQVLIAMKNAGELATWGAELTADFFLNERNLAPAKAAGCSALFCGVESFDVQSLLSFNKRQNVVTDQVALIRKCLEAGILFLYGLIFDPTHRTLHSIAAELDYVLAHDEIPLPSYFTLPIPLLGTPLFFESLKNGAILPNTRIRDLDAYTLCLRPLEGLQAFSAFWPDFIRLKKRKAAIIRHEASFLQRYKNFLNRWQKLVSLGNAAVFVLPKYRNYRRTFISATEILDPQYQPAFHLASKFASYFQPTLLTDSTGSLNPQLEEVRRFEKTPALAGVPASPNSPSV
jgi:hypothetical protein